jgi:hypothetical protein
MLMTSTRFDYDLILLMAGAKDQSGVALAAQEIVQVWCKPMWGKNL